MNPEELWAVIDTQQLRTADLLSELAPGEGDTPSMCDGWTVRDVAAHLTLQAMTLGPALLAAFRHPGSLNHIINPSARDRAARPTDRLIAEIRGMVGSRRHNVGVTPLETLIDIVVHGQDIAVPLGRNLAVAPWAAVTTGTGSGGAGPPGSAGSNPQSSRTWTTAVCGSSPWTRIGRPGTATRSAARCCPSCSS